MEAGEFVEQYAEASDLGQKPQNQASVERLSV